MVAEVQEIDLDSLKVKTSSGDLAYDYLVVGLAGSSSKNVVSSALQIAVPVTIQAIGGIDFLLSENEI